ncbi:MAG: hypothetical protein EOR68_13320 [Mesorhizobium sp.]|uniref:hypothetical protein n=1 Tax=Mesorhizobium sp. TaxID=1871066 RepID=UPI000FE45DC3|nr:hypothetical protein [Mesorhizobium sp.]RWL83499.1 MAG: hypothetical protein EOR69_12140 [Mesorhizobium sp.]RWL90650.1 MAG: hypothetical protein EOR67_04480 [Mesorhizobium sp.]RWL99616.1 MAG: hypothetical protein EOR68_13320 [Mesorhizobium sp.]RWM00240.1 MAG: hypothetical protein EOR70_09715 [Mesorhizobium sp.]TIP03929.1 MAG: hypothetical protein E5X72_13555 [Mesorhizobium sp.]
MSAARQRGGAGCRGAGSLQLLPSSDDTVRPYSHELYNGTIKAFKKLFPAARSAPQEQELRTQANDRCMNGKVLAWFVGANASQAKTRRCADKDA